jgi:aminoglycoside phosphotransferase (APT) family kinase protein
MRRRSRHSSSGFERRSERPNLADPRRAFPSAEQLAWVERCVGGGAKMRGGRRILGGITSTVHRLSLRLPGGASQQVVLKRFTDPEWGDTPAISRNEAAALTAVEGSRVPAPRLLGVSADGAETGGIPSLLMTRAPGRVWLTPEDIDAWIRQLAELLPTIHAIRAIRADVRVKQPRDPAAMPVPARNRRPALWRAAKALLATPPPATDTVFAHGDYQHFNVLWSRGQVSALVDWSGARIGSPDLDVGHCRLNLAVLFSADVAERFRRGYEAEAGRRLDPWWDVHQLLNYDDTWPAFIPLQVAGRAPIDVGGMTGRVEELLALALARA